MLAGRRLSPCALCFRAAQSLDTKLFSGLILHRYLCDFAYYCSLYHGERRAALIHVPSSGSLASADTLVPLLQATILAMLEQLKDPSDRQPQ